MSLEARAKIELLEVYGHAQSALLIINILLRDGCWFSGPGNGWWFSEHLPNHPTSLSEGNPVCGFYIK